MWYKHPRIRSRTPDVDPAALRRMARQATFPVDDALLGRLGRPGASERNDGDTARHAPFPAKAVAAQALSGSIPMIPDEVTR
jgi:hypothetical protein